MASVGSWDQICADWQVPNYSFHLMYVTSSYDYCYHSVNVISYALAQSDHIKRHLILLGIGGFFFTLTSPCYKI